jgi:protein gp37
MMSENSKIQWTHHTFSPWQGCTKVSDGCLYCYAEQMMDHHYKKVKWGPKGQRIKTSIQYWRKPFSWDKKAAEAGTRHRVFCASLCDVFEDREELELWREQLFELINQTKNLNWLLLTKRPEFMAEWFNTSPWWMNGGWKNPGNVWVGTSIESQNHLNRANHLAQIPAVCRFISMEPMIGPIDLQGFLEHGHIHWVIVGGESGRFSRPLDLTWARSIRDQCREAGVAFFMKQTGRVFIHDSYQFTPRDIKGGDLNEWPEDIRIREFPKVGN